MLLNIEFLVQYVQGRLSEAQKIGLEKQLFHDFSLWEMVKALENLQSQGKIESLLSEFLKNPDQKLAEQQILINPTEIRADLLVEYVRETLPAEQQFLIAWANWQKTQQSEQIQQLRTYQENGTLENALKIRQKTEKMPIITHFEPKKYTILWRVAAGIILVLGLGLLAYYLRNSPENTEIAQKTEETTWQTLGQKQTQKLAPEMATYLGKIEKGIGQFAENEANTESRKKAQAQLIELLAGVDSVEVGFEENQALKTYWQEIKIPKNAQIQVKNAQFDTLTTELSFEVHYYSTDTLRQSWRLKLKEGKKGTFQTEKIKIQ